jgi:hypothetical protein
VIAIAEASFPSGLMTTRPLPFVRLLTPLLRRRLNYLLLVDELVWLPKDVLLPLGANLLVVDLGQGLLDGLDEEGFVGGRRTLECALDHVVPELVLDEVVEAGGAGDLLDVAGARLLIRVGQTRLDRV